MAGTEIVERAAALPSAPLISHEEIERTYRLANILTQSGFFKDSRKAEQGFAKILLGRDLGLSPTQALIGIHIVEGKPEMSANLQAQRLREFRGPDGERYDYRITEHTDTVCSLTIRRREVGEAWEEIGTETFAWADAVKAGLANKDVYKKYPRNMLFARCLSNAVAFHVPEVMSGYRMYNEGDVLEPSVSFTAAPDPVAGEAREAGEPSADVTPADAIELLSDQERTELVQACVDRGHDDMTMLLTAVGADSTDNLTHADRDAILAKLFELPAREPAEATS